MRRQLADKSFAKKLKAAIAPLIMPAFIKTCYCFLKYFQNWLQTSIKRAIILLNKLNKSLTYSNISFIIIFTGFAISYSCSLYFL